jgi:shikimate kinase
MPSPHIDGKPLFLVGFMGTGKSTVGRLVAARLSRAFVDTDDRIESEAEATVAEIFAGEGEAAFRAREAGVVARLVEDGGELVVSVGGGAPAHGDNLDRMLAGGVVIALEATPDEIFRRVGDVKSRPLLARAKDPRAEIARLLELRQPHYARAHLRIDTTGLAPSQVVQRVTELLAQGVA